MQGVVLFAIIVILLSANIKYIRQKRIEGFTPFFYPVTWNSDGTIHSVTSPWSNPVSGPLYIV